MGFEVQSGIGRAVPAQVFQFFSFFILKNTNACVCMYVHVCVCVSVYCLFLLLLLLLLLLFGFCCCCSLLLFFVVVYILLVNVRVENTGSKNWLPGEVQITFFVKEQASLALVVVVFFSFLFSSVVGCADCVVQGCTILAFEQRLYGTGCPVSEVVVGGTLLDAVPFQAAGCLSACGGPRQLMRTPVYHSDVLQSPAVT